MRLFALIGFPLKHSFSKKYFSEKFENEKIDNCKYELFELSNINSFPELLSQYSDLEGINVTIPHKQNIIPFLTALDTASAGRIGAVNCIKVKSDGQLIGYNTDYYGFKSSLDEWFLKTNISAQSFKALVLGNGGAAKAVFAALKDLGIEYKIVSRQASEQTIQYSELNHEIIKSHQLIINTSPVGTFPKTEECPDIPYHFLDQNHFLYDLVYNPEETLFLQKGKSFGAATHNGLKMLHLQAEKAWKIWNQE